MLDEPIRGVESSDGDRSTETAPPKDILETALDEQRRDWMSGKRILAAELLLRHSEVSSNPADAADLIYHEYLLRNELGECPDWEEYLRDFPRYVDRLRFLRQADQLVAEAFGSSDPVEAAAAQLDDYELLEELGRGGMGVVFKARQKSLKRLVAVKMIRAGEASDEEERKRFENEAQAVARLQHPNIVQVYEVGETDGRQFLALEFVEGRSLARHLDGTPLPARQAASMVETLARAIHYAHEKQIIHRDLKPSNVLVAGTLDRCILKVTDFGLAKRLDLKADTRTVGTLGTPSYMAPEQVDAQFGAPDRRTDVYGLGAILYELLTGRPPFRAESPLQTLKQVAEAEPARPRLLNPAVPRDLETVCLKCLQKDPAHRYGSAAALADELARFVKGEPVRARPIGPGGRLVRWYRRNPLVARLTAILVLALVGGIAGIARQWRQADLERRNAVASDLEAEQLLSELIVSNPVVPIFGYRPAVPSVEPLLKAAAHCKNHLQKNPGDLALRIALTNVYGRLGTLYLQRRQIAEMEASFHNARDLWEPLVSDGTANPVYRDWLATTYDWEALNPGIHHNWTQELELIQRANRLWEELAEEQPANLDFMQKVRMSRSRMMSAMLSRPARDSCLRLAQDTKGQLVKLVQEEPSNRVLRKQLALTCLVLGEICSWEPPVGQPSSFWREAHDHYKLLAEAQGDDILVKMSLAASCRPLIRGQSSDPYCIEAVRMLEQADQNLAALLKQNPECDWLREALLENYCVLALCHSKVGRNADATKIVNNDLQPLVATFAKQQADPAHGLFLLRSLSKAGGLLRESKQPAAALTITRQAAALTLRYAANSMRDPGFLEQLAIESAHLSAILHQLGDATLSLQMAELARDAYEEASRATPDGFGFDESLSNVWMRIGKAHWSLGARDKALAALRESAAIQKRLFEREPSNRASRARLSSCYDRLVYFGSRSGDLSGAATALLEQEKLWFDDVAELTKTANAFEGLAAWVTVGAKGQLTPRQQVEKSHYLSESKRIRDAAKLKSDSFVPGDERGAMAVRK
jgi:tRNA A-37 threonylcarbamoyl transferase component Bud32/tetratricopeptide (TPR) repeat protein